jgi:putative membrane protein insertion efficiency factor
MIRLSPVIAAVCRVPARLLWAVVRLYQVFVSPVLPPACRYHPSCSRYAAEALLTHGALRGTWLAVRRLLRCHPWAPGGPDPVPPRAEQSDRALTERRAS